MLGVIRVQIQVIIRDIKILGFGVCYDAVG